MEFDFVKNYANVSEIEEGIRNGWLWQWLEERCDRGFEWASWCRKVKKPGSAYCTVCGVEVVYGTSGKTDILIK